MYNARTTCATHTNRPEGDMGEDVTNIFVKYLPPELDDQGLKELFSLAGEVISAKVMLDLQQCTSLGYGFVRFTSPESAERAILMFNGYRFGFKILLCKLSNLSTSSLEKVEISTNLYIKHLPSYSSEDSLRELFSNFGPISTAKVLDKNISQSSLIGFVQFERQEDATAALREMNGSKLPGSPARLLVRYAESDKKRAERKANCWSPTHTSPSSPTEYYQPLEQFSLNLCLPSYYAYYTPLWPYYHCIYPVMFSST